jgi:hypothetical protein
MPTPSDAPGAGFPKDPQRQESVGGADAVPKTSYVVGQGTEPETQRTPDRAAPAEPGSGGGRIMLAILMLVIVGGLVYALALR